MATPNKYNDAFLLMNMTDDENEIVDFCQDCGINIDDRFNVNSGMHVVILDNQFFGMESRSSLVSLKSAIERAYAHEDGN